MRFPTIRRSSATGDSSQVLLGAVRRNRATFFLASIACLVIVFGELPLWLSLTSPPVEVELGYTQGSVVSGAVFQGRPFRLYTGKRVFTQGWEKRIGRSPIKAEKNLLGVLPKGIRLSSNITCTKWSVVTTIFEPSEAIQDAANFGHDWCIVIVGDYKTPKDFIDGNGKLRDNDSVFYFDMAEQKVWGKLPGEVGAFVTALPYNHFARKNFGFLFAILHGAKFIYDFDDDNYVKKGVNGRPRNLIPNETVRYASVLWCVSSEEASSMFVSIITTGSSRCPSRRSRVQCIQSSPTNGSYN